MKKLTKLIAFALSLTFVLSALSGCRGKETPKTTEPSKKGDEKKEGPSWSWNTSPVTLDWFIDQNWFSAKWDAEKTLVFKTITEKTGVKVNFIIPPGDAKEKINTMIASNQLPDMMTMTTGTPHIKDLEQSGKVYPLSELIEKHAPTFKAIVPDSMVKWFTAADGKWYEFPNFFDAPEKVVGENAQGGNAGMVVRKDLMEQLGIKMQDLETQSGLIAALKKVKESKLEYKGKSVIPLLLPEECDARDGFFLYDTLITGFFGIPLEDKDGNLADPRKHPKFLEGLKFLNECYREGLISKENFTMQTQQYNEKLTSGSAFLAMGNLSSFKNPMKDLYNADNKAIYTPAGPLKAKDGAKPTLIASGGNGWTVTMVSKDSKNADRAIRLMEYMYSDEGSLLGHWGVEGKTYKKRTDGYFEHTDSYNKEKSENKDKAAADYGLENLYWVHNWQLIVSKMPRGTEGAAKLDDDLWHYYPKYAYDGRAMSQLDPDAKTPAAIKNAEIKSYLIKQYPRILMAKSETECVSAYEEMIKKIYDMGQEEVNKARNEAFQSNKKNLGIKYMGPWHK